MRPVYTFSSSSFGFFLSNESGVFFFSFLPFPFLVPFTGKSSGLISEFEANGGRRMESRQDVGGGGGSGKQKNLGHEFFMKVAKKTQWLVHSRSMPLNCITLRYTVQWRYLVMMWEDPPGRWCHRNSHWREDHNLKCYCTNVSLCCPIVISLSLSLFSILIIYTFVLTTFMASILVICGISWEMKSARPTFGKFGFMSASARMHSQATMV